jgi:hypothetical protein
VKKNDKEIKKMIILNVPYKDKDFAKSFGAKWSPFNKYWYFEGEILPDELKRFLNKDNLKTQLWEQCPKCGSEPIYLETGRCRRHS